MNVAATFRDMDLDSQVDYAVMDWETNLLGIGIQTGGYKTCPPPNSANLAAMTCGIKEGATLTSPGCTSLRQLTHWSETVTGLDRRQERVRQMGRSALQTIYAQSWAASHWRRCK